MTARIPNKQACNYVAKQMPFIGSNLKGIEKDGMYIVYSYGEHFPAFIFAEGAWFENEDDYSASTKRHMNQARPTNKTIPLSTKWMCLLAQGGYNAIAKERILHA